MGLRVRLVLVVLSLLAIAALAVPLALSLGGQPNRDTRRGTGSAARRAGGFGGDARTSRCSVWSTATTRCTAKAC